MTSGKTITLIIWTFVGKVTSLLFNMLSSLVITFLRRRKCLLISWLQSPPAAILEPRKIKSATVATVSPSICHEVMGPDVMILVFWMPSFKPAYSLSSFTFSKRLFSSSSLSAIRVLSSAYLHLLIFLLAILILACYSSSWAFLTKWSILKSDWLYSLRLKIKKLSIVSKNNTWSWNCGSDPELLTATLKTVGKPLYHSGMT